MQSWFHCLEWQARVRGDLVVYSDADGDEATFAGLLDRVERTAGGWVAAGIRPGDRVLVVMRNSVEYLVQLLALQRAGALASLLNWRLSSNEFRGLIELFDPSGVIADAEFAAAVDEAAGDRPLVRVIRSGASERWSPLGGLDAPPPPRPEEALRNEAVFAILHTSGTTGQPKGIPLTNGSVISGSLFGAMESGMRAGARHLRYNPMFHFAGLAGALYAVLTGGHAHILPAFDAGEMLDLIEARRIEFTNAPPVVMRRLVDEYDRRERKPDLSSLREIWYGTSPISPDLLERAMPIFRCGFRQNYGQTETSTPVTQLLPSDHVPGSPRLSSAGRLQPFWELRIVDPQTGVDVAEGDAGELWVRGQATFPGYWRAPEMNAAAFTDDGWFKTGDIGRRDEDGYVFILDRAKDMVVSGGENVYPTEVEIVLARHPAIAELAVIGVPSERWGETLHAIVVVRPGHSLGEDELVAWSRDRLAHFKCPTSVEFRDALPRNETGKVMRRTLREPFWAGHDRRVG